MPKKKNVWYDIGMIFLKKSSWFNHNPQCLWLYLLYVLWVEKN